jgi:hypothetical protein
LNQIVISDLPAWKMNTMDLQDKGLQEAIAERHSVRRYLDKPLDADVKAKLEAAVQDANSKGGLHIQLVCGDAAVFGGALKLMRICNEAPAYFALIGPDSAQLDEQCGYWGERLVLYAQQLGLNTCWVGMGRKGKSHATLATGERFVIVIACGYGAEAGKPHKSKPLSEVCEVINVDKVANDVSEHVMSGTYPQWFHNAMQTVLLAPTAMNQQKFMFTLDAATGLARADAPKGAYTQVDLGIAECHFDIGAGFERSRLI